jgi:hypothetical protein
MNLLTSSLSTSFSVPSSPSWAHGGMETDATISDETDKRIGLNCFVYYFSMTYTSIIATESIVTNWMNLRKAFSGKSFTIRIPSKAPIPVTVSIRRFSENEPQLMLSQAKIWKGTFSRLTTRKNQALMPMYSILLLLNIAGKLTGLLSDGERMSVSLLNSLVSRFLRDTNGLRPVNEMRLFSLSAMLERLIPLLYRIF